MRKIVLTNSAFEDLVFWSKNDVKTIRKIFDLMADTQRNPFKGLGKPEALKHNLAGITINVNS
jgi:toxin YoeB